jgi:YHS domain-containing protein
MGDLAVEKLVNQRMIIDPVCGMNVVPGDTKLVAIYQGHSYWFCAYNCREAFEANPRKYLEPKKRKSWFGRYLERLTKANEQQFGGSGPKCH